MEAFGIRASSSPMGAFGAFGAKEPYGGLVKSRSASGRVSRCMEPLEAYGGLRSLMEACAVFSAVCRF